MFACICGIEREGQVTVFARVIFAANLCYMLYYKVLYCATLLQQTADVMGYIVCTSIVFTVLYCDT